MIIIYPTIFKAQVLCHVLGFSRPCERPEALNPAKLHELACRKDPNFDDQLSKWSYTGSSFLPILVLFLVKRLIKILLPKLISNL